MQQRMDSDAVTVGVSKIFCDQLLSSFYANFELILPNMHYIFKALFKSFMVKCKYMFGLTILILVLFQKEQRALEHVTLFKL